MNATKSCFLAPNRPKQIAYVSVKVANLYSLSSLKNSNRDIKKEEEINSFENKNKVKTKKRFL